MSASRLLLHTVCEGAAHAPVALALDAGHNASMSAVTDSIELDLQHQQHEADPSFKHAKLTMQAPACNYSKQTLHCQQPLHCQHTLHA